ncbi:MAG: flagellin [Epulopiscium sp.]|nr:flagellin [Candidatus Epulonipiscium sp.]
MIINHNLQAMNTHRQLGIANTSGAKSMEKLSSGYRVNRAGDDAAGLAISEKMRGQIRGLNQASRNSQDAISLIQTAEGALNETHAILQRMRELAVQSSTDTNTDADRTNIQDEINQLADEITRISETTEFNTMGLLDGSFKDKKFHIGANEGQDVTIAINNMSANELKVAGDGTGKANFEVKGADVTSVTVKTGLVAGEQTAKVVKVDNVTIGGANQVVANYALTNDKGEIIAVSNDGKDYSLLAKATGKNDLATATVTGTDVKFDDAVISGTVSFEATINSDGETTDIENIKATASVDVAGLESGEYEVIDKTAIEAIVGETLDGGTEVEFALKGADGKIAAVSADGKDWYGIDKITDWKAEIKVANLGDAIMTSATELKAGGKLEIKADGGINVSTQEAASKAITTINDALENVSKERSKLGAMQNRLEHTIKNLDTSSENLQASEARIRDVDMAKEMMEQTKQNILSQAATAMLAQANQAPQGVLQLLR